MATSTLGFLEDATGRYVLNTQRHIAEDSVGLTEPVLSRLLGTLESAGYVKRRIEKIRLDETDQNGLHLVRTRVLVQFTMRFWADLGLRYVFERVQRSAMKKRVAHLREIAQRRQALIERKSLEELKRQESRKNWMAKEARERSDGPVDTPLRAVEAPKAGQPERVSTSNDAFGALSKLLASKERKRGNST